MNDDNLSPSTADACEPALADAVESLAESALAGQPASLDEAVRRFPQHVRRLKKIWPAIEAMLELGSS